jgi:hypothetical protein
VSERALKKDDSPTFRKPEEEGKKFERMKKKLFGENRPAVPILRLLLSLPKWVFF